MKRRNVEFNADGVTLRGWFYTPAGQGPFPTVVMAHGFSGVKEMTLDKYAEVFSAAGLAVLVYDNRNLGESGGEPRSDIDPVAQLRDYRFAISYAETQPECDKNRIGIWGTSYTGGTVCAVAALDLRVKAVVSQVPFINGHKNIQQFLPLTEFKNFHAMIDADRARRLQGEPSQYMKMCSLDPNEPHVFPGTQTYNYIHKFVHELPNCTWENRVTVRSLEWMLEYDVTSYMERISPAALLMIVSDFDTTTPSDIAIEAFGKANEPKQLMIIKADHYAAYVEQFPATSAAARDWFVKYL